jgi:hypothetical protein
LLKFVRISLAQRPIGLEDIVTIQLPPQFFGLLAKLRGFTFGVGLAVLRPLAQFVRLVPILSQRVQRLGQLISGAAGLKEQSPSYG